MRPLILGRVWGGYELRFYTPEALSIWRKKAPAGKSRRGRIIVLSLSQFTSLGLSEFRACE